jgi:hypothetical protein
LTTGRAAALAARFDAQALRPFDPTHAPQACAWPALAQWCVPGGEARVALATCTAADLRAARAQAAALALQCDGTRALLARGGMGRLALRVQVKWQDLASAWSGRPHAIWDSGWVPDEAAAWLALARFVPRRASFIVWQPPAHAPVAATLQALSATPGALPVRVLLLCNRALPLPGLAATALAPPPAPYMPA